MSSRQSELAHAAKGSVMTFAGAATSAAFGFAYNFLVARLLGAHGAGVILQAVAIFTIILSLAKLGLDTTAVWMLPRLMGTEKERVRSAVVGIVLPALIIGSVIPLAWLVINGTLGIIHGQVGIVTTVVLAFLPAASLMTVALAATRAFGGVLPFNLIGNMLVPAARVVGLMLVAVLGGAALAGSLSWSIPWVVGVAIAVAALLRQTQRTTREVRGPWKPSKATLSEILSYSVPRTLMSGLEQAIIWIDVVLVGAILGSVQAGIYGSASRFVSAGVVVFTAIRIVVAPRFSALLASRDHLALEQVYRITGCWILLFGAPIYVLLAIFAPTVLSWLGPAFGPGAVSMVTLCLGSITLLAAGNVQSMLLMSGRIKWGVINKTVVAAFNIGMNLILIPHIGIEGAAISWAASMVLDNLVATIQVSRALGVTLAIGDIGYVLAGVALAVGLPSMLIEAILGQGVGPLIAAFIVSCAALLGFGFIARNRLHLAELVAVRSK